MCMVKFIRHPWLESFLMQGKGNSKAHHSGFLSLPNCFKLPSSFPICWLIIG